MILARWLLYAGLLTAVGALALRFLVLPRLASMTDGEADARRELPRFLALAGLGASGMVAVALAGILTAQFLAFRDPFSPAAPELFLLLGTDWGVWWTRAAVASAVAALGFLTATLAQQGPLAGLGWAGATLAVLLLCCFPALTGHAATEERFAVAVSLVAVHIVACGAWLGALGLVLLADRRDPVARSGGRLATLVPAFSPVALVAAVAAIGTGLGSAVLRIPDVGDLLATPYGRLLLGKTALVLVVVAAGARNWRRLLPEMRSSGRAGRLRRAAAAEWWIAQAVLLVTALLVGTSPPIE